MSQVVTISGSPSISSRLSGVLDFVHSRLEQHNVQVGWTNVRDLPAEDLLYARVDSPSIVALNRQIEQADAVIVASPVYKASYTGLLKACLDLLPQKSLENKVVFPMLIGGTMSHFLALDTALKPVLVALGAENILRGVFVLEKDVEQTPDGDFHIHPDIRSRLTDAVNGMVEKVNRLSPV